MERNNQNPNILENLRIVILEVVEKLEAELNNKFKGKRFPTMVYEGVRYHASKFVKVNVPKFGVAGGNIVDIKNWSITARTLHTKARTITIPFPAIENNDELGLLFLERFMERRIDPDKLIEYEEGLKIAEKNKLGKDLNSEDDSSLRLIERYGYRDKDLLAIIDKYNQRSGVHRKEIQLAQQEIARLSKEEPTEAITGQINELKITIEYRELQIFEYSMKISITSKLYYNRMIESTKSFIKLVIEDQKAGRWYAQVPLSIIIETAKRALATIREDLCYGSSKQVKRPTDGDKDEKIPDKLSVSGEMVI